MGDRRAQDRERRRRDTCPRFVLAALAALVLAGATGPAASAAAAGSIAGTVQEATTHAALGAIVVCAVPARAAVVTEGEESAEAEHCATTGAGGDYTIEGLEPASYDVEFNPPLALVAGKLAFSQRDYIAQAFEGAYTEAAAKPVTVSAGATTTGIDAELAPGGEISGRVTAAATGAPVAGAFVCAVQPEPETLGNLGCGETSAGGDYTIFGLAPGQFRVVFFALGFAPQVYNGKMQAAEATPVTVIVGQVAGGIDAALLPQTEGLPTGETEPGPGGTGQSGPTPGLRSGSGARPLLALRSRVLTVRHGAADVVLTCHTTAGCHGRLRLYALRHVRRGSHTVVVREPLGGASFSLASSRRGSLTIRLDRRGLRLLRAGHGDASVKLAVALTGAGAPELIDVRLTRAGAHKLKP